MICINKLTPSVVPLLQLFDPRLWAEYNGGDGGSFLPNVYFYVVDCSHFAKLHVCLNQPFAPWMDGWTGNKANHFINIITQDIFLETLFAVAICTFN